MNIGIPQTIWAVGPFFTSVADYLVYEQRLLVSHKIGIFLMAVCAAFIALSNIVDPFEAADSEVVEADQKLPVYYAVLASLVMPLCVVGHSLALKYGVVTLAMPANQFTFAYFFLMSLIL